MDREIEQLVAYRPSKPGFFLTPARATPDPAAGKLATSQRNTLYMPGESIEYPRARVRRIVKTIKRR